MTRGTFAHRITLRPLTSSTALLLLDCPIRQLPRMQWAANPLAERRELRAARLARHSASCEAGPAQAPAHRQREGGARGAASFRERKCPIRL